MINCDLCAASVRGGIGGLSGRGFMGFQGWAVNWGGEARVGRVGWGIDARGDKGRHKACLYDGVVGDGGGWARGPDLTVVMGAMAGVACQGRHKALPLPA